MQMQMQGEGTKGEFTSNYYDSDDVDDDDCYDDADDVDDDYDDDDDNDYCWQMNVSRGLRGLGVGGQSKKGGKKWHQPTNQPRERTTMMTVGRTRIMMMVRFFFVYYKGSFASFLHRTIVTSPQE